MPEKKYHRKKRKLSTIDKIYEGKQILTRSEYWPFSDDLWIYFRIYKSFLRVLFTIRNKSFDWKKSSPTEKTSSCPQKTWKMTLLLWEKLQKSKFLFLKWKSKSFICVKGLCCMSHTSKNRVQSNWWLMQLLLHFYTCRLQIISECIFLQTD